MKTSLNRSIKRALAGFSLPEVTIAVGITAMGLTSVLGLVPTSLDTLKQAGNIAAETRITQKVLASLNSAEWTDADGADRLKDVFQGRRYYFDEEAVELEAADATDQVVTYVAEVELATTDVHLSTEDASSTQAVDPFLRRVRVKVTNANRKDFDFASAKPNTFRTYSSLVTRSGK